MSESNESKINHIVICGCGAAGANTFMHLIYAFPDLEYTLIDNDKVEHRNYSAGTQPYTKADLNRPKVQALQRIAKMSKGNVNICTVNERINSKLRLTDRIHNKKETLVVDCFDNAESRNLVYSLGKSYNVVHIGFSAGLTGSIEWDSAFEKMEHDEKDEEIDVCEMSIARPFIMGLTSIASITLSNFITNGKKSNVFFSKDLNIFKF